MLAKAKPTSKGSLAGIAAPKKAGALTPTVGGSPPAFGKSGAAAATAASSMPKLSGRPAGPPPPAVAPKSAAAAAAVSTPSAVAAVQASGAKSLASPKPTGALSAAVPKGGLRPEDAAAPKGLAATPTTKSAAAALGASMPKGAAVAAAAATATPSPQASESRGTKRKLWGEDAMVDEDLGAAIRRCKIAGMDHELHSLAKKISPGVTHKGSVSKCVGSLRGAWLRVAGNLNLERGLMNVDSYGSHAQNTDLEGSGVEVSLRMSAKLSPQERDSIVMGLRQSLSNDGTLASTVSVNDGLHWYAHAQACLAVEIKNSTPRLVANAVIIDQSSETLTIDKVIRQMCDAYVPSRDLVRLVKL